MKHFFEWTFGMLIIVTVSAVAILAQADGAARLGGTWNLVATPRVCATGDAITSFQATYNFDKGGTLSAVSAGTGSGGRGREQHGVWRYLGGDNYRFRFRAYLFDAAGVATGYQILTHNVELDKGAQNWTSVGLSQTFSLQGVQTAVGCSTIVAERVLLD
jgi:hypothetical protein